MKQQHRRQRNSSNLFNPNNQGLSTYDLTYVTAGNNRKKTDEIISSNNDYKGREAA